jgi:hypothetical protein
MRDLLKPFVAMLALMVTLLAIGLIEPRPDLAVDLAIVAIVLWVLRGLIKS